jgi:membrane protease YdiL (CAAX protease family)
MNLGLGFFLRVSLVVLAVLALVIAYWLVFLPSRIQYYTQPGPSVDACLGLLVIAVLYVSISGWIRFGDKEVRDWERFLLLSGMVFGLVLALFESLFAWSQSAFLLHNIQEMYPTLFDNLSETIDYMLVIAAILFLGIVCFTLIPRRKSIVEWMKNV